MGWVLWLSITIVMFVVLYFTNKFWFKFTLFIVWMVANIPLRLFISGIQRLLWFPYHTKNFLKKDADSFISNLKTMDGNIFSEDIFEREFTEETFAKLMQDGDGSKFFGYLYYAYCKSGFYEASIERKLWNKLTGYFDVINESFKRFPDRECDTNFSGDMLSGYLLAIKMKLNNKTNPMTENEKKLLISIFENTIKNFFMFKHPSDTSRGRILTWWAFGQEWIQARAFMKVAVQLDPKNIEYKVLSIIIYLLSFPSRLCPDYGIWLGKLAYLAWYYQPHSTALYALILKDEYVLKVLQKRYPTNLDIEIILLRFFNYTKFKGTLNDNGILRCGEEHISFASYNYHIKKFYVINKSPAGKDLVIAHMFDTQRDRLGTIKIFSLKRCKWNEEMCDLVYPHPSLICKKYCWECCPTEIVQSDNQQTKLDTLIPLLLMTL